jgi:hypothetical protein
VADDNVMAALAGAFGGVQDVLGKYIDYSMKNKFDEKAFQRENYIKPEDIPDQLKSQFGGVDRPIRKELLTSLAYSLPTTQKGWVLNPSTGEYELKVVGTGTRSDKVISNQPIVKPEKPIYTTLKKSVALQMLDSGVEIPAGTKIIDDTSGSGKPDIKEDSKLNDARSALEILNRLETNFNKTPTGVKALGSRAVSLVTGGAVGDTGQRVYEDALRADAAKFYRAYTGDTRLSNDDAEKRAYPLLPTAFQDKDLGKGKFEGLRSNVIANVRPILEKRGIDVNDFINKIQQQSLPTTPFSNPSNSNQNEWHGSTKTGMKFKVVQ